MTRDPLESRALSTLVELVRSAVKRPSAAELDQGLHALRARMDKSRRHPALRWSLAAATLMVVAALGVAVFTLSRQGAGVSERPVALSRVEGGKVLDGGYLSESGGAGIKLLFDEGSEFALSPGTRGRLRSVDEQGAHLAIEHGSASLRITQNREHRWSVEAGPFLVTVTGTDFTVLWDRASERFELRLRRGRVTVSGPVVGDGFALRPGQKLTVSLPKAETVIVEEGPETSAAELPHPAPLASAPPAAPASSAPAPTSAPPAQAATAASASAPERRWREALAHGQWDKILADVDRDGIDATLEKASSEDLLALADAARYRRRVDLARTTLLTHRRRFPGSARSLDAIFLLGRVEELRAGGKSPAIERYDEYLARAPAGTYAAEALGRKMILTKDLEGAASARPIAAEYLRRFPEGSYARAARALERVP
jgi:hypothetical protein